MTMSDDGARKRIESELERVNREVVALKTEPRPEELEGLGDTSSVTEEFDAISYTEIEELRSDRLGRLLDRAAALDEALHRIDEGTYGVCVACGNRILEERLRALPEAARCNRCQEELEASPAHERLRANEWKLAGEAYEEREKLQEKGFERRPEPLQDVEGFFEQEE